MVHLVQSGWIAPARCAVSHVRSKQVDETACLCLLPVASAVDPQQTCVSTAIGYTGPRRAVGDHGHLDGVGL